MLYKFHSTSLDWFLATLNAFHRIHFKLPPTNLPTIPSLRAIRVCRTNQRKAELIIYSVEPIESLLHNNVPRNLNPRSKSHDETMRFGIRFSRPRVDCGKFETKWTTLKSFSPHLPFPAQLAIAQRKLLRTRRLIMISQRRASQTTEPNQSITRSFSLAHYHYYGGGFVHLSSII